MRFTRYKQCPYCDQDDVLRIPRARWMRLLPQSRKFECNFCRRQFLQIGNPKKLDLSYRKV